MFSYTSILQPEYKTALEELLFFNPRQHIVHSGIVDSIEAFGEPIVENDGKSLRVKVSRLDDAQTIFALDRDVLAGLLLYSRVSIEQLVVIHIAVREDYAAYGDNAQKMLVMRMTQHLIECARRIKGIESVGMMYGGNRTKHFPVKRDIMRG